MKRCTIKSIRAVYFFKCSAEFGVICRAERTSPQVNNKNRADNVVPCALKQQLFPKNGKK